MQNAHSWEWACPCRPWVFQAGSSHSRRRLASQTEAGVMFQTQLPLVSGIWPSLMSEEVFEGSNRIVVKCSLPQCSLNLRADFLSLQNLGRIPTVAAATVAN